MTRSAAGAGERSTRWALRILAALGFVLAAAADRLVGGHAGFGIHQQMLLALGAALLVLSWASARARRAALALLAAGALALVLAEGAARLFFSGRFTTIYRLDPDRLHALVPGARKFFVHRAVNGGGSIPVAIDSRGYRGRELEPRSGRRRVVVFGDSCVEAEFSRLEDTFVERLGVELGTGVQMVNAGVVGYGPDQVLVRMRQELADLEAELAVVVLFADNDLGDLLRNKLFRLGETGSLEPNDFTISPLLRSRFEHARSAFVLERALHRALDRRRTELDEAAETVDPARQTARVLEWLEQCRAEYEECVVRGELEVREVFDDHYDADASLEPDSPSARYKLALLGAVVGEMHRAAEAAGSALLVVVLPSRLDVCGSLDLGWIDPVRWPAWERGRLASAIETLVRERGLPCVSLLEAFRAGGDCGLYFRGGDYHWNDRGQALAARLVAERIRGERWLE